MGYLFKHHHNLLQQPRRQNYNKAFTTTGKNSQNLNKKTLVKYGHGLERFLTGPFMPLLSR